jgi:hypothetical protein
MTTHRVRTASIAAAALVAVCVTAFDRPSSAIGIGFDPDLQSVELGTAAAVDIVFSDLGGEIISAYDLDITYDASVLDATGVVFTTALGDEFSFEVLGDSDVSIPGFVDLAQLSLLPDAALAGIQAGDDVAVASIRFDAVGVGTTDLAFSFDEFNDVKGLDGAILPIVVGGGSVSVTRQSVAPVPEPSAALLFAVGVVVLVGVGRQGVVGRHPGRLPDRSRPGAGVA